LRILLIFWQNEQQQHPLQNEVQNNFYVVIQQRKIHVDVIDLSYTHTHPFNSPLSGTTRVSRYQKGKTNLDFAEARESEWQWHQLGRM